MNHVTMRKLSAESGKVWGRIKAGEEIVVTRNGKPFAVLLRTAPGEVEGVLRAWRAARFSAVLARIHAHAAARGLDHITDQEIEAEISAARAERRAEDAAPGCR